MRPIDTPIADEVKRACQSSEGGFLRLCVGRTVQAQNVKMKGSQESRSWSRDLVIAKNESLNERERREYAALCI